MIKELTEKLIKHKDLSEAEAEAAMRAIMSGQCTDAQIAGFLVALRMKGETVAEITACARVMREKATPIAVSNNLVDIDRDEINIERETIVDTCGTGGTGTNTFNISTATAFVVAGAGVKVAKHGNRAASSVCGSADVISELGVNLDLEPERVAECVRTIGIGFLFAPLLHSAMKYAIGPRRELGIRTVFNILGPLTNPAGATAQVMGVYDPELTEKIACVLLKLGVRRAFVVHGKDSLDEITITGKTRISELHRNTVKTYEIQPEDFGLKRATLEDIKGGDAQTNAGIVLAVLKGETGPRRNIVLLNAAYALLAADKVVSVERGVELAQTVIDSGKALDKLEQLRQFSNS